MPAPKKPPFKKPAFIAPPAPTAFALRAQLRALATPEQAKITRGFFKVGPGEYAAHDQFIGVANADLRKVVKDNVRMPLTEIQPLLNSKIHEERLAALLILVNRVNTGGAKAHQEVYDFYMKNLRCVNNWDLTDATAAPIVGAWLQDKDRRSLADLAHSNNVWERRIAITATHHFIKQKEAYDTLSIASVLVEDGHELIQKAVGWMLREVGKQVGLEPLNNFLNKHAARMPLAMLRAAVDALPAEEKAKWLEGRA